MKDQLLSAMRLVKELYERRERKILQLAINKSRTKSQAIDDSVLLEEEKRIFDDATSVLDKYRKEILLNLVNARLPFGKKEEQQEKKEEKDSVMIRFTGAVPKFLGQNLEIHGPFEEGDIATLPKIIADILIKKNRAESMNPE